jgi:DNA (cytosine-5)-methyltransferase 1
MRHGSLFSGIGGFDLASEWMGWENVFHCEWNEFGQKVLKYYWPKAITYNDITKTDFSIHRGTIDILTGGFPCQPYSSAGKRLGKEDERHLWPEMLRAIREIQPSYVVGENVRGLTNWNNGLVFDEVQADLETQGYEVTPFLLPACGVNAPHRRDRIWFIAYSKSCADSRNSRRISNETKNKDGKWIESSTSSEQQIQLPTKSNSLFGNDSNSSSLGFCKHSSRKELFFKTFGTQLGMDKQNDSYSELERLQGCTNAGEVSRKEGTLGSEGNKFTTQFASIDKESNASNSSCIELQGSKLNGSFESKRSFERKSGQFSRPIFSRWEKFPTVAPICDGNDGISDRLDGITFSKWRNESIKAGGNAVVPQVVYQIFKAIDQYNQLNKQLTL